MSIKYYGEPGSQPSRTVQYCLTKLGIEHEYIETLVFTGTGTEEFKRINPIAKIPVIVDGDYILRESWAIVQYLCENYEGGDKLLPKDDPKAKASVIQWLFWNTGEARDAFIPAIRAQVIYPFFFKSPLPDEEETKKLMDPFHEKVKILEDQLSKTTWLVGEEFTLADVHIFNEFDTSKTMLKFDLSPYPKLEAWYEACKKDEILAELSAKAIESIGSRMEGYGK